MSSRETRLPLFSKFVFLIVFGAFPSTTFAQQADPPPNNPASIQPSGTEIFKLGGSVSAPKLVHSVEPKLSKAVHDSMERVYAWVRIKLVVETDGTPSNLVVLGVFDKNGVPLTGTDSNPIYTELEEGAVEAAKQYKFEPGKKGGKPVRVQLMVAINFL